jgi:hypothetical protein
VLRERIAVSRMLRLPFSIFNFSRGVQIRRKQQSRMGAGGQVLLFFSNLSLSLGGTQRDDLCNLEVILIFDIQGYGNENYTCQKRELLRSTPVTGKITYPNDQSIR